MRNSNVSFYIDSPHSRPPSNSIPTIQLSKDSSSARYEPFTPSPLSHTTLPHVPPPPSTSKSHSNLSTIQSALARTSDYPHHSNPLLEPSTTPIPHTKSSPNILSQHTSSSRSHHNSSKSEDGDESESRNSSSSASVHSSSNLPRSSHLQSSGHSQHPRFICPEPVSNLQQDERLFLHEPSTQQPSRAPHGQSDSSVSSPRPNALPEYRTMQSEKDPSLDLPKQPAKLSKKRFKQLWRRCKQPSTWKVPSCIQWIPKNLTRKGIKPVIRSSINTWIAFLLLICDHTNKTFGMASFFAVITSMLVPAMEPIAPMLWKCTFQFLLLFTTYAWTVLASKLAAVSRGSPSKEKCLQDAIADGFRCSDPSQGMQKCLTEAIFQSYFVRPLPSIIWALFEFVACAVLIRIKMKYKPLNFPCVFGIICAAISANYGPMYPYFYPNVGLFFIIPNCVQTAITVGCTLFILPETCNFSYNSMLCTVTENTRKYMQKQIEMLSHSPTSEGWKSFASTLEKDVADLKSLLTKMKSNEVFLDTEFSYGRLKGQDLVSLQRLFRKTILRLSSFSYFCKLIEHNMQIYDEDTMEQAEKATLHSRVGTPAPSMRSASPNRAALEINQLWSPTHRRTVSSQTEQERGRVASASQLVVPTEDNVRTIESAIPYNSSSASLDDGNTPHRHNRTRSAITIAAGNLHSHQRSRQSSMGSKSHRSRSRLRGAFGKIIKQTKKSYKPVGMLEAQHYLALENRLPYNRPQFLDSLLSVLKSSSVDLFDQTIYALDALDAWLNEANHDRFKHIFSKKNQKEASESRLQLIKLHYDHLSEALSDFEKEKCFEARKPYEPLFQNADTEAFYMHSLRSLFVVYYYESHLMQAVRGVLQILNTVIELEGKRSRRRLWWPLRTLRASLYSQLSGHDDFHDDVEDVEKDLKESSTQARNPDADSPSNLYHVIGLHTMRLLKSVFRPMNVFVLKVGALAVICTIPAFVRNSARWYYYNRGLWAVILATMSMQRYTADTVYGYLMRVVGTFFGTVVGMIIWYTGNGHGLGNAYGLAVVLAAMLPFVLFVRVHLIILTPMPSVIFSVTVALVVSYSWKAYHEPGIVTFGVGWDVAYRRFLVVLAGITVAFIFSFLPKPLTARYAVRKSIGNSLIELGALHCEISNFSRRVNHEHIDTEIQSKILNLTQTVRGLKDRLSMVSYEPSVVGKWPMEKYEALCETELSLLNLLNSLMTTFTTLDDEWMYALLRRIGWFDHKFIADQMAVLYMSSNALQTGNPLPQIVPAPLVDRFFSKSGDVFLPPVFNDTQFQEQKGLSYDMLSNMNYLNFAVGCTIAYAIVNQIDRIMFVTKSLCGEIYDMDEWPFLMEDEYGFLKKEPEVAEQQRRMHDMI
ncbi:transmembrane transporter [Schizosaccharomyces osmophilus]|uniref:Transmembrane transporter n=1 Tax=Schizosaccharomyces osmophilus TaxID=2545709 RepID=A0AAE9WAW5_9SCHI|nr:transmembrane transporter [Schizosaccharomyces osmophilus]WBW72825.1 transmembrane transporter [Schizosaccharomyces osmophilus]